MAITNSGNRPRSPGPRDAERLDTVVDCLSCGFAVTCRLLDPRSFAMAGWYFTVLPD
jgi:hypothetical protein